MYSSSLIEKHRICEYANIVKFKLDTSRFLQKATLSERDLEVKFIHHTI